MKFSPPSSSSSSSFITFSWTHLVNLFMIWPALLSEEFWKEFLFCFIKFFVILLSRWFERTLSLKKTVDFMPRWLERISGFCPTTSHFASCFCPESQAVLRLSSFSLGGRSNIFCRLSIDGKNTCCCMKEIFSAATSFISLSMNTRRRKKCY